MNARKIVAKLEDKRHECFEQFMPLVFFFRPLLMDGLRFACE